MPRRFFGMGSGDFHSWFACVRCYRMTANKGRVCRWCLDGKLPPEKGRPGPKPRGVPGSGTGAN